MMSITVQQPWAWSVIFGGKDVENRVQNLAKTYTSGPLAIHAGLAVDLAGLANPAVNRAWDKARAATPPPSVMGPLRVDSLFLDTGRIIGLVDLVGSHHSSDCHRRITESTMRDEEPLIIDVFCSTWADRDAWHLELTNARPLSVPLVYRGHQSIRPVPTSVQREILARVAA